MIRNLLFFLIAIAVVGAGIWFLTLSADPNYGQEGTPPITWGLITGHKGTYREVAKTLGILLILMGAGGVFANVAPLFQRNSEPTTPSSSAQPTPSDGELSEKSDGEGNAGIGLTVLLLIIVAWLLLRILPITPASAWFWESNVAILSILAIIGISFGFCSLLSSVLFGIKNRGLRITAIGGSFVLLLGVLAKLAIGS